MSLEGLGFEVLGFKLLGLRVQRSMVVFVFGILRSSAKVVVFEELLRLEAVTTLA